MAAAVFLLGDRIADGLAGFFWQWNRQTAYADDVWWPFYVGALLVTYAGFGLSAVVVAQVNRHRPAMLLAYVASTFTVLAVVGLVLEILIVQYVAIPIPHPLFYAVFTTLPFQSVLRHSARAVDDVVERDDGGAASEASSPW